MKIAVGLGSPKMCRLAQAVTEYLEAQGYQLTRFGTLSGSPSDYIATSLELGEAVSRGEFEQAVLFCNTGTGVTIVANKIPGVRAALCPDAYSARIARQANNANVLVLGIRLTGEKLALEIVEEWLKSDPGEAGETWKQFHVRTDAVDEKYRTTRKDQ